MKKIIFLLLLFIQIKPCSSQIKDAFWLSLGIEQRNGSVSKVNALFQEDTYRIIDPFTFKMESTNPTGMSFVVDASGLVNYYLYSPHNGETEKNFFGIWDKTSFRFGLFKMLGNEDKNTRIAVGGQMLIRTFGLTMDLINHQNLKSVKNGFGSYQAGPVSVRRRFGVGPNIQIINNFNNILLTRAGLYLDYEPGSKNNVINIYPEINMILHYRKIGIHSNIAYRNGIYMGDSNTGTYYPELIPAKSVTARTLIFSVGVSFDLVSYL